MGTLSPFPWNRCIQNPLGSSQRRGQFMGMLGIMGIKLVNPSLFPWNGVGGIKSHGSATCCNSWNSCFLWSSAQSLQGLGSPPKTTQPREPTRIVLEFLDWFGLEITQRSPSPRTRGQFPPDQVVPTQPGTTPREKKQPRERGAQNHPRIPGGFSWDGSNLPKPLKH